jgi:taurine dioxygenase
MTTQTARVGANGDTYCTFEMELPTPTIGGLIRGLDLREAISEECKSELRRALARRGVLFLPNQHITPEDHARFARIFGDLEARESGFGRSDENPYIELVEGYGDAIGTDVWHTDVSWHPRPPVATCLHAQILPPTGGDTMWSSMTAAYEGLSPRLKELVNDLTAEHTWEKSISDYVRRGPDGEKAYRRRRQLNPPVERKVVEIHPVTGLPLLYVNDLYTTQLKRIPRSEGVPLLEYLTGLARTPEYQVRFRWQPQSLVIWDNLSVQHYAVTDYKPHHRRLHRITVHDVLATFKPVNETGMSGESL